MQEKELYEQRMITSDSTRASSSTPPCCGSGCAVCVLDYWVDDEPGLATQEELRAEPWAEESVDPDMQAMLEAFEQAQQQAEQMIAQMDGE
ncbi:MAG: hypothetical protein L0226_01790 [Acidobacteria bacterium]|nr:hypothetical protein [Acidobacteriota bacterium]